VAKVAHPLIAALVGNTPKNLILVIVVENRVIIVTALSAYVTLSISVYPSVVSLQPFNLGHARAFQTIQPSSKLVFQCS